MPNVELLTKTLALIEDIVAHPGDHHEQWDQSEYGQKNTECGAAFCFAGFALQLDGAQHTYTWGPRGGFLASVDGRKPGELAGDILGLTFAQRVDLFCGDNTLIDLQRIVGELVAAD